jgi:hypothetical protein
MAMRLRAQYLGIINHYHHNTNDYNALRSDTWIRIPGDTNNPRYCEFELILLAKNLGAGFDQLLKVRKGTDHSQDQCHQSQER